MTPSETTRASTACPRHLQLHPGLRGRHIHEQGSQREGGPFSHAILACVSQGRIEHHFTGGPVLCLEAGSVLMIPPQWPFRSEAMEPSCVSFADFDLRDSLGRSLISAWYPQPVLLPYGVRMLERIVTNRIVGVAGYCRDQSLMWDLLADLTPESWPERVPFPVPTVLSDLVDWIDRHLAQTLNLKVLGAQSGLSRQQLDDLFRCYFDCAPIAWIRRRRLERAQELLASSDLSIAEISSLATPWDHYQFKRNFLSAFGCSPSAWREQIQQRSSGSEPA